MGYELNHEMIHKTNLLLGIKGYYSNIKESELSNEEIIKNYKNLWQVEQAFRISKSDLKTRPIFHNKQQAIETHIIICFMALALAKYIEINTGKINTGKINTGKSIKSAVKTLKKSIDAKIYNPNTKQEFIVKAKTNETIQEILKLI